jgi:hypothetical protein
MEGIYFESTNFDLVLENLENSKSCGGRLSAPLSEQWCQTTRFTTQSEPRPLPMHAVFATVLHPWFPPPHVAIRGAPPSQFSSSHLPAPISTSLHALFYSSTQRALPPLHPTMGRARHRRAASEHLLLVAEPVPHPRGKPTPSARPRASCCLLHLPLRPSLTPTHCDPPPGKVPLRQPSPSSSPTTACRRFSPAAELESPSGEPPSPRHPKSGLPPCQLAPQPLLATPHCRQPPGFGRPPSAGEAWHPPLFY